MAAVEASRNAGSAACNPALGCAILPLPAERCTGRKRGTMKEKRRVLYKKGVFVCPKCRQSYVQEKWIEEWRIRCHKCDYRGTLTEVSVEEHMDEETVRH
jgi:hypothetical protein